MSNRNEQMNADALETRVGIRVLANNEIAAVAGADVWDAYKFHTLFTNTAWLMSDGVFDIMYPPAKKR